jgi:ectoine utilization protein EutC
MKVRVLTQRELRKLVPLDLESIETVAQAFSALASGGIEMPPILSLRVPEHRGEIDVKTAYVPGIPCIAIKISPGFFDNPKLGLPSLNGLMVALDSRTGLLSALLLDNGYLTDIRTAAAGAVAARALSRPESKIAAVLGTGAQARLQMHALALVRPLGHIRVWGRRIEQARALAQMLSAELAIAADAVDDPASAVRGADIVVTTTPTETPILSADWLTPGQHVTAMGSDAEYKNELDPKIIALSAPYVPDRLAQCARVGELRSAIAAGLVQSDRRFSELGAILTGSAPGRSGASAITVADLTGTGIQDTAIAALALRRAADADAGFVIET